MNPVLPYDVLQSTFDHVTDEEDLLRSCLASKSLLPIARRALYASIRFEFCKPRNPDERQFWRTRTASTKLSNSTIRIEEGYRHDQMGKPFAEALPGKIALLKELVESVPSLQVFVSDNLSDSEHFDQYIAELQTKAGRAPLPIFRIVLSTDWREDRTLKARYEGFKLASDRTALSSYEAGPLLEASRSGLRSLEITISDSMDLSTFTRLEYLSVRIPDDCASEVTDNLLKVLPNLSSLRSFVLKGNIVPGDIADLLGRGKLVQALPPSLHHLSLEAKTPYTHQYSLICDLSPSTKLMSAALKTQGNAHFAAKEWKKAIKFYTEALELKRSPTRKHRSTRIDPLLSLTWANSTKVPSADAEACIEARPKWSKGYARLGEVRARQQQFEHAIVAYEKAIERAEDTATKLRYVAAKTTAKTTNDRNQRAYAKATGKDQFEFGFERTAVFKLGMATSQGFQVVPGGSLELLGIAYQQGQEGFKHLDQYVTKLNGQDAGQAGTNTNQELSECLMLDPNAFIPPAGSDPSYPLIRKLSALQRLDFYGMGLLKYYQSKASSAKVIIADLNKRLQKEDWLAIRRSCSVLIRGNILNAWISSKNKSYGDAIQAVSTALEVLDEANRVWSKVDFDDKGNSLRPTMKRIIQAFKMELLLEASRDAFSESAKKVFTLESVEAVAQQILDENPQSEFPTTTDYYRLDYYVLPTARAYLALGLAASQRAGAPVTESKIPSGKAALAKIEDAEKAAFYYDLAAEYLPDDDYRKPQTLFMALQQHLRAGGKKASEIFKVAEEAERLRKELSRFHDGLNDSYAPREFVEYQVKALRDAVRSPSQLDDTVKAIPTLNLQGTPASFNPNTVLNAEFWLALPGAVGLVDVLGLRSGIRGDYA
ncbi:hypothetical protein JCM16303_001541 [Sporobolomyces ruberrimus]